VRALAEAAQPQVKVYYEASLDYGRSTTPESGLYYIGTAQAAREWVAATDEPNARLIESRRARANHIVRLGG